MSEVPYRWVPPGLSAEEADDFLSINSSIPTGARNSIVRWLTNGLEDREIFSLNFFRDFQVSSGIDLAIKSVDRVRANTARSMLEKLKETTLVYMIDFKISQYKFSNDRQYALITSLERILHSSGSKWTTGARHGRYGLVERVPAGVTTVMEQSAQ